MRLAIPISLLWVASPGLADVRPLPASSWQAGVSAEKMAEIDARLHDFYAKDDPDVMSRPIPKFTSRSGLRRPRDDVAPLAQAPAHPLLQRAGFKATEAYEAHLCAPARQRRFGESICPGDERAAVEGHDRIESLVDGWLDRPVIFNLSELPNEGAVKREAWADDYWRTQWGGLSYRYSQAIDYTHYRRAVKAYDQPDEWHALARADLGTVEKKVVTWSPAEKYDLSVADAAYTLTLQQKKEGLQLLERGNVPEWFGLCDGWAAASIMVPAPKRSVVAMGLRQAKVRWTPADVRALTTLSWARGEFAANFIGGRCDAKKPRTYPNGRLVDPRCFDNNPASFHLALGNLIGKSGQAFLIDSSFDLEVWNQPIIAYNTTYFNPLEPTKRSKDWREVAVAYDEPFKAKDRFQTPLTRGKRHGGERYDDRKIRKVVGVIADITGATGDRPEEGDEPMDSETMEFTYTYDLELSEDARGELIPTGGEWHSNLHPDFMWMPRKDTVVSLRGESLAYSLTEVASPLVRDAAAQSSAQSLPLCSVLNELVRKSADVPDARACVE